MVEQIAEQVRLSLEEWSRLYDTEGPFEYVEGKRIPLSPNKFEHGLLLKRLFAVLLAYEESSHLGEVFIEMPFVQLDTSSWVKGSRVPDLLFILTEKLRLYKAQLENYGDKPLILVPDLAIEIVSPGNTYTEVDDKVTEYLADGVQAVWVVNPRNQSIKVHRLNMPDVRFRAGETLIDELLPGFSMELAKLFSE